MRTDSILETLASKRILAITVGMGVLIHAYTEFVNSGSDHFRGLMEDFSERRFILGTVKALAPFIFPYGVSLVNYYTDPRRRDERV